VSALLAGVGLARFTVDGLFHVLAPTWLAYLVFIGGVLCPLAWLLGQTVPVLTNLMKHARTGEASGYALYWSTLGSFVGSVSLSLLVMQWLGVSAAVLACAVLLALGSLLLGPGGDSGRNELSGKHAGSPAARASTRSINGVGARFWAVLRTSTGAALVTVVAVAAYLAPGKQVLDTAYADYEVKPLELPGHTQPRGWMANNSLASLMDDGQPPHYARYVQRLRHILLNELTLSDTDILVLGAGGFTLSHQEPTNRYTYVDIDPAIHALAEQHFLKQPITGQFVVDDARRFVRTTDQRFAAVVVDVFSNHTSIPSHLVTTEFWADTRRALLPTGVLLINLILDAPLQSPYARNLLATIEGVYGRCGTEVLHKTQALSNVILVCRATGHPIPATPYTDERNGADLDKLR
ncbi:MAG: fused MFS/spermidine synthase, partial [Burkholderiales bacterium]|nr:fused MFS/spermidine synthase [Burkholderiales bacterium]